MHILAMSSYTLFLQFLLSIVVIRDHRPLATVAGSESRPSGPWVSRPENLPAPLPAGTSICMSKGYAQPATNNKQHGATGTVSAARILDAMRFPRPAPRRPAPPSLVYIPYALMSAVLCIEFVQPFPPVH